jgi:hypothetical protein
MNAVENDSVAADTKAAEAEASAATAPLGLAEADRELLMTALTTAAPFALPLAIRGLLRNLPLVLVFAVAVFIALRYADGEPTDAQPDAAAAAAE